MPKIIKNEAGEDEEVFTKDELAQAAEDKAQEARDAVEQEKQEALDAAEEEKATLEKELEGLRDKEKNFNFREQRMKEKAQKTGAAPEAETEDALKKEIEQTNKRIDELTNQRQEDTLNDFIKDQKLNEDKDKKERFDHFYKKLGSDAKTKDEINKAAKQALTLATDGEYRGENDQSIHSTGADMNYRQENTGERTPAAKSMGSKLGITEEDARKHREKHKNN